MYIYGGWGGVQGSHHHHHHHYLDVCHLGLRVHPSPDDDDDWLGLRVKG